MKIVDITPISLKDLRAVLCILKEAKVSVLTRQNDLVVLDENAFDDLIAENSELKDLLTDMEEPLYP